MQTFTKLTVVAGISLCSLYTAPAFAQGGENLTLEEIVITGRKREESLQEVPISISVLSDSLILDAGIVSQNDLFELVPGIHYDEAIDRNSALPSVRGVQSNEVATNRTKVTAFIDGMPILGSQGSIQFGDVQQVEVYRGPQSASFGRSTFGGAINYITKDPSTEFEGSLSLDLNDYGRKILSGVFSGPLTDNIGYILNLSKEDSDALDDYVASDGTEYGTRGTEAISGKLVFNPSEAMEIEVALSRVETEDGPSVRYFISQDARDACFDGTVTAGMGGGVYGTGTVDCDWEQGVQIAAQNDRAALLIANGETDEDRLFLAEAQSLPADQVGGFDTRDRATVQIDYLFDNGSALQFSGMKSEENYIRGSDNSRRADDEINIALNTMTGFYDVITGGPMATLGIIMSDPTDIEETYAEVRWVSPSEERLRYVVGASYYDYSFTTTIYFGGYGAILQGQDAIDRYNALVGNDGVISSISNPRQIFDEAATNQGMFFNAAYDLTDRLTLTLEGRYQSDDTGGTDTTSGVSGSSTTNAFLPRLSFNYNLNDSTSFYGQLAKGNNPGGVNVGFFNPANIATLDNGIPDGLNSGTATATCDGSVAAQADASCNSFYVDYDSQAFVAFDEETLINLEFGMKGAAFDNRLQYAAAIYKMEWKDQAQSVNLDWDNPNPAAIGFENTTNRTFVNEGDLDMQGLEFEGTYQLNDNWRVRGTFSYLDATYADYCSVGVVGSGLDTDPNRVVAATSDRPYSCYDVSGLDVAEQPATSFSLSPSFSSDLDSGIRFNARADIRFEGEEYLDQVNVAQKKAVSTINLSAGVSSDSWTATLYVNNVLDEDYPADFGAGNDYSITTDTAGLGGNFQSNYIVTPRAPRTIGLRASYSF